MRPVSIGHARLTAIPNGCRTVFKPASYKHKNVNGQILKPGTSGCFGKGAGRNYRFSRVRTPWRGPNQDEKRAEGTGCGPAAGSAMGRSMLARRIRRGDRALRAVNEVRILELHGSGPSASERHVLEHERQGFASNPGKSPHSSPCLDVQPSSEDFPPWMTCSTSGSVRASFSSW